jgi:hypothetical protein
MRSRRGLGVLAVCGLVLGMMAISASGAQAGMWMINGSNVGAGVELKISASIEPEGGGATLLTLSGGNSIAITCTTATVTGAVTTLEKITGTINFSGCTTKINGILQIECKPKNEPLGAGATIEAVLHEGKAYAKATGTAGVLTTFKFNCVALPEVVKVTGSGWLEDCNNEFEKEKVTHLFQEGKVPAEKLGGLLFGANKATVDGSAIFTLTDEAHKGMKFSGLAE